MARGCGRFAPELEKHVSIADHPVPGETASPIPTGTVTFLFTDIEGSTRLLERLREEYADLLAEQRGVLRAAFAEWNGFEVDTQGDSFFVAFPRAVDALRCTVEAQRAIAAHRWPQGVQLRVRMMGPLPWCGRRWPSRRRTVRLRQAHRACRRAERFGRCRLR